MSLRNLEPEEWAVLEAIFSQCCSISGSDYVFEYNFTKTQEYLIENGIIVKYELTKLKQFEIINKLANDRIIDVDYIVDAKWINKYRAVYTSSARPIESGQDLFWAKQTDWAYDTFQLGGLVSIRECYDKYGSAIFIRMSLHDIKSIEEKYRKNHEVQLKFDGINSCLSLRIDDKEWRRISQLHSGGVPYQVLHSAYCDHPNQTITRSELIAAGIKLGGRSLISQVFSDNSAVKALNHLLLEVDNDSILFITKPVMVTLADLIKLEANLKIA